MTKQLKSHDLANIFPMLGKDEAKALADDISEHGLREPIILLRGKILDGRNRYAACFDAGIEPRFVEYTGDNPSAYVVSVNLKRRHLDESQRAMVAKKLATLSHGQRQTGKFAGVMTQAKAASLLNVSERSIRTAGAVTDKAVPEIVTAVDRGDISVSAAAPFAKQPKEEQAKLIAESATPADAVKSFHARRQRGVARSVGDDESRTVSPNDSTQLPRLKRLADYCRVASASSVAEGILPSEILEMLDHVAVVTRWLDAFSVALFRAGETKNNRPDDSAGPHSSTRQSTPTTSSTDDYPDLPACLDRRKAGLDIVSSEAPNL